VKLLYIGLILSFLSVLGLIWSKKLKRSLLKIKLKRELKMPTIKKTTKNDTTKPAREPPMVRVNKYILLDLYRNLMAETHDLDKQLEEATARLESIQESALLIRNIAKNMEKIAYGIIVDDAPNHWEDQGYVLEEGPVPAALQGELNYQQAINQALGDMNHPQQALNTAAGQPAAPLGNWVIQNGGAVEVMPYNEHS